MLPKPVGSESQDLIWMGILAEIVITFPNTHGGSDGTPVEKVYLLLTQQGNSKLNRYVLPDVHHPDFTWCFQFTLTVRK